MKEQGKIHLLDRILSGSLSVVREVENSVFNVLGKSTLESLGAGIPVIDFDEVNDYYNDSGSPRFDIKDFSGIRLPYPSLWMEAKYKSLGPFFPDASCCHLTSDSLDSFLDVSEKERSRDGMWLRHVEDKEKVIRIAFKCYLFYKSHGVMIEHGFGEFYTDESGNPVSAVRILSMDLPKEWTEEQRRECARSYSCEIFPVILALQFMNCKNVKLKANDPVPALSKSFQRRHGRPLVSYHTLEIEPMKRVLETEGDAQKSGLKRALHLCRGHFATYTPEKGMLGRKLDEPVTVWRPAHARGSAALGAVVKDYIIKGVQNAR